MRYVIEIDDRERFLLRLSVGLLIRTLKDEPSFIESTGLQDDDVTTLDSMLECLVGEPENEED